MELLFIAGVAAALWLYLKSSPQGGAGVPADTATPSDAGSGSVVSYSTSLSSIAAAVARVESGNRQTDDQGNTITSSAGALGVMQLLPSTAAQLGVDPYNEAENRAGGATYLQQLNDRYGNWHDALAAYYWGPGHVDRALASGSSFPSSVEQYIKKVEGFLEIG